MLATKTLTDEILDLKKQRRAILLAHHYQEAGDSGTGRLWWATAWNWRARRASSRAT